MNSWARTLRGLLILQVVAGIGLLAACSESPTGVEEADYTADYVSPLGPTQTPTQGQRRVDTNPTVASRLCIGNYGPPYHSANSMYHVLDSVVGTAKQIHRLASQWHNDNSRWTFHTPNSNWYYTGPYVLTDESISYEEFLDNL